MRVLQGVFIKSKCPHFAKGYKSSKYSTATVTKDEETSKPVYPPILDVSEIPTELRRKEKYYEKIKKMNTIEEKLLALNVARYYGWPSFHVREGSIPYNFLPLTQFITRTEIREVENLPVYLDNEETKKILAEIKPELEKVIVFENCGKSFKHELETVLLEENELPEIEKKNIKTKDIIFEINSAFCRILHRRYPHLFQAQVDYEPRLEAFWRVGGFYPTREDKKLRKEKGVSEARLGEYIDRFFQYYGSPILQLRSRLPLPEMKIDEAQIEPVKTEVSIALGENDEATDIVAVDEKPQLTNYALQEYRYDPKTYLQIPRERIHGAIIPGFWPNDPYRFGLLSYHNLNFMAERPSYDSQDSREAIHCQAILAAYAWVYGQACYQGFSTYYDITYPFATQTILTDGKLFAFYQYQMNTTVLHTNANSPDNPLRNECYATLPQELYHDVDNDVVKGWNDKALLHLISMYINAPKDRGINLSPYLNPKESVIGQIKDDGKRLFLHENYQRMTSHRPRRLLAPEIYDWERIYKIEHKRRVLDARKRFFELFQDPINDRKWSDTRFYIPKDCRDPAKPKKKYATLYYPECQDYHDIV